MQNNVLFLTYQRNVLEKTIKTSNLAKSLSLLIEPLGLAVDDIRCVGLHPVGERSSLEIVVEEIRQTLAQVFGILTIGEIMGLSVIFKQPGGFAQTTERHKHLDSLIIGNSTIGIVVHDEHRGLYLGVIEEGRVLYVEVEAAPEVFANTALCLLILELAAYSCAPSDASISTCHIANGSTGSTCSKHISVGYEISYLIAAPTLTLDGHVGTIHPLIGSKSFGAGHNTIVSRFAR